MTWNAAGIEIVQMLDGKTETGGAELFPFQPTAEARPSAIYAAEK